jgi:hypothetical protein
VTRATIDLYGCSVLSNIRLFGVRASPRAADVTVQASVSSQQPSPADRPWHAQSGVFELSMPDCLRATVRDGREVRILHGESVAAARLHRVVVGPLAAALLHQRQYLPFHASAVCDGSRVLLLAGASGSGKTELTLALLARGWQFVSDDLSAVRIDREVPVAMPGVGAVAIWPAQRKRAPSYPQLSPAERDSKLLVQISPATHDPLPVGLVCVLTPHEGPVTSTTARGVEAFRRIRRHLHLVRAVRPLGIEQSHFHGLHELAARVPIVVVAYSQTIGEEERLVDAIETHWREPRPPC